MIKIIEMEYLDDNFINTSFCKNISLNEKITFSKGNIYYFGNYKEDKIELIKKKLIKNRKNLLNAIQNNVKFIISGNSFEMFNNSFKPYDLNIYTNYSKSKHSNKIRYYWHIILRSVKGSSNSMRAWFTIIPPHCLFWIN